jgi:multidrug efflux system membrane fusion protein
MVASLAAVGGCEKQAMPAMSGRPPAPVEVTAAVSKDVPVYIDQIGKAAAFENVTIMPRVAGQVTSLHFTDGADVKKGELLVTIDDRPYVAAANQAEAQLHHDQANAANAQKFAEREAELFRQKSISAQENDQAIFAAQAAAASVAADQAALDAARLNVGWCKIASPIDGRVGQHQIDAGNVVKADEGGLVLIQRMDPVYVDFTIPEQQLDEVRANMARGTLKTLVWLPNAQQTLRDGSLTFLDNAVQDGSGTVKLRATLQNKDRYFWPGQFVRVRLVLDTKHGAVLVPEAAPQIGQAGTFVFVVKGDSVEQRPVKLGQRQADLVVVEDGLKPGEAVVTDGQNALFPGAKVAAQKRNGEAPEDAGAGDDNASAQADAQDKGGSDR